MKASSTAAGLTTLHHHRVLSFVVAILFAFTSTNIHASSQFDKSSSSYSSLKAVHHDNEQQQISRSMMRMDPQPSSSSSSSFSFMAESIKNRQVDMENVEREEEEEEDSSSELIFVEEEEACRPVGECQLCPMTSTMESKINNGKNKACGEYGKRREWECYFVTKDGKEEGHHQKYKSCRRTETDEQILMMRLQVICALIGSISIMSVRKQKVASASLFDQRRLRKMGGSNVAASDDVINGGVSNGSGGGGGGGNGGSTSSPTSETVRLIPRVTSNGDASSMASGFIENGEDDDGVMSRASIEMV